jgi:hypothetical protein
VKSAAGSALTQSKSQTKTTSAKAAKAASKVLRDGRTSKAATSAAGSALSQSPSHTKSPSAAKRASAVLSDRRAVSKTKTVAASSLSQLRNPRSGRYVMVDRTSGSIISHKKSPGSYKSVPIAKKVTSRK